MKRKLLPNSVHVDCHKQLFSKQTSNLLMADLYGFAVLLLP